jgi:6-phosphofructokinase 2
MTQSAPLSPILTVTLNPALDFATETARVTPGPKLRCAAPHVDAGGGGINVSRAIAILGGASTAFAALGGSTGARLAGLLADQSIEVVAFPAPGETRESLAVTETETGQQFRFVLPGPPWPAKSAATVIDAVLAAAQGRGLVVFSGSLPPGVSADLVARLAARLPASVQVIADLSGAALAHLVATPGAGIALLRLDQAEAEALAARALTSRSDTADFAQSLVRSGVADRVVVARDADGSVLASGAARIFCAAPDVPVKSRIGAGDSFVGALTLALSRGLPDAEALAWGVAAASAAVMTDATALCTRADVARLLPLCRSQPV